MTETSKGKNVGCVEVTVLVHGRVTIIFVVSVCLDSSEDFMARGGLRFSLSVIVSEL